MLGDELDPAVFHHTNGRLGERLRFDEPLRGDQRLNRRPASLAAAERQSMILGLDQQVLSLRGRRRFRLRASKRSSPAYAPAAAVIFASSPITLMQRQIVAAAGFKVVQDRAPASPSPRPFRTSDRPSCRE